MGKSNYYDKMEWQDSIKVIITQKLHQIRNWEFHNMLYGMSTIEMIENLIIENLTENRVIRRFGWPPTNCGRACKTTALSAAPLHDFFFFFTEMLTARFRRSDLPLRSHVTFCDHRSSRFFFFFFFFVGGGGEPVNQWFPPCCALYIIYSTSVLIQMKI